MSARRLTEEERELAASVWDAYRPFVESVARQHLIDQADAVPDVVQTVGLIVCRKLHDFRGAGGLRSWIFRVTLHEARRVRRVERRHGRIMDALTLEPSPDPLPSPHDALERSQRVQAVREALAQMKPAHREILRQDLDAPGLYRSEGAVWSLRYRARKKLRSLIDRTPHGGR